MDLLLTLLVLCVILAIMWWAFQQLTLPQPFRMVIAVLFAIIAIVVLLRFVPGIHL